MLLQRQAGLRGAGTATARARCGSSVAGGAIAIGVAALFAAAPLVCALAPSAARAQGTSLRVINDRNQDQELIQRVRIVIGGYDLAADQSPPMDLGDPANAAGGSFTIELWLRGVGAENDDGGSGCSSFSDSWIECAIVLDRDVNGVPSFGDFGISVCSDGALRAGVTSDSNGASLCAPTSSLLDGAWHHVALTRNGASGQVCIFTDGVERDCEVGSVGPVSWNDTAGVASPSGQDPTLVLGAEKHGFGLPYPGFRGWIDEARFSSVVRYAPCGTGAQCFARPTAAFAADASTLGLYHFDDGIPGQACSCAGPLFPLVQGTCLADSSGLGSYAECRHGSTEGRFGPEFSAYTPFGPADSDGDGVANAADRCPFRADASQADAGGYEVFTPDGIGNACQCGDTDGNNAVFPAQEAVRVRNTLAGIAPGVVDPAKCSVIGGANDCDLRDAVVLRRSADALRLGPGIASVCDAATP